MKIVYYPDKRLFQKPEDCTSGVDAMVLVEMMELMESAGGVGLSAIQVGIKQSFFVMKYNNKSRLIINPKILELGEDVTTAPEGCLSAPGFFEPIARSSTAKLEHGLPGARVVDIFEGFEARIVQHETEHCEGKMFTDNFKAGRKGALMAHMMKLRKAGQIK